MITRETHMRVPSEIRQPPQHQLQIMSFFLQKRENSLLRQEEKAKKQHRQPTNRHTTNKNKVHHNWQHPTRCYLKYWTSHKLKKHRYQSKWSASPARKQQNIYTTHSRLGHINLHSLRSNAKRRHEAAKIFVFGFRTRIYVDRRLPIRAILPPKLHPPRFRQSST